MAFAVAEAVVVFFVVAFFVVAFLVAGFLADVFFGAFTVTEGFGRTVVKGGRPDDSPCASVQGAGLATVGASVSGTGLPAWAFANFSLSLSSISLAVNFCPVVLCKRVEATLLSKDATGFLVASFFVDGFLTGVVLTSVVTIGSAIISVLASAFVSAVVETLVPVASLDATRPASTLGVSASFGLAVTAFGVAVVVAVVVDLGVAFFAVDFAADLGVDFATGFFAGAFAVVIDDAFEVTFFVGVALVSSTVGLISSLRDIGFTRVSFVSYV